MDSETQQVMQEGQKVEDFAKSEGWQLVKAKFTEKIMDLQSIRNLDHLKTATAVQQEIKVRTAAVDIILEVIKEVEGMASQSSGNKGLFPQQEEDEIIHRQ